MVCGIEVWRGRNLGYILREIDALIEGKEKMSIGLVHICKWTIRSGVPNNVRAGSVKH